MKIKIDKNIPIPAVNEGRKGSFNRGRERVYPFTEMEVGSSFLVPKGKVIGGPMAYAKATLGHDYTTQKKDGRVRVWRIS